MTHFTINNYTVHGLGDSPHQAMNIQPKKKRTRKELALMARYTKQATDRAKEAVVNAKVVKQNIMASKSTLRGCHGI